MDKDNIQLFEDAVIQESIMLPVKPIFPENTPENVKLGQVIQPAASTKKKALHVNLQASMDQLLPKDATIMLSTAKTQNSNAPYANQAFLVGQDGKPQPDNVVDKLLAYCYLKRVDDNLGKMTDWQMKKALEPEEIKNFVQLNRNLETLSDVMKTCQTGKPVSLERFNTVYQGNVFLMENQGKWNDMSIPELKQVYSDMLKPAKGQAQYNHELGLGYVVDALERQGVPFDQLPPPPSIQAPVKANERNIPASN